MATDEDQETPGGRYALLIGLAVTSAVAAVAFGRVYQGTENAFRLMLAALVALALAHLMARQHVVLATVASAAGLLMAIGILVFPHTTVWALPTLSTVKAIGAGLRAVSRAAALTVAPAPPVPPLLLAGVVAVWTAAFASHSLATRARSPFLSLLPPAALIAFAGIVVGDGTRPTYVVLFLLGSMVVLFADAVRRVGSWGPVTVWHGRRFLGMGSRTTTRGAWRVAVACLAVALFVPWLLPGFGSAGVLNLQGGDAQAVSINPIVDIRPRLVDNPDSVLFTVRAEHASYWRMISLDTFDGRQWRPSDPEATDGITVGNGILPTVTVPSAALDDGSVTLLHERFEIGRVAQPWLPVAYPATSLALVRGTARYDLPSSTVVVPDLTYPGMTYNAISQVIAPSPEQLTGIPSLQEPDAATDAQLPADTPQAVFQIAQAWSSQGGTPYQKILAIQQHLRSFTYDLHVPAPNSTNDLLYFLTKGHRGYCEQFAGAMAVLLRALGYPARVAVGFTPGTFDAKRGVYTIRGGDAHAWVEVLFPGYGWLSFEPTPTRANPIAGRYNNPPPNVITGAIGSCPVAVNADGTCPVGPGGQIQGGGRNAGGPDHKNPAAEFNPSDSAAFDVGGLRIDLPKERHWVPLALLAAVILLALVLLAIPVVKAARRRVALARSGRPSQRVLTAYRVLLDSAADVGFGRGPAETLREYRSRLSGAVRFSGDDFDDLTALAGRAAYGADGLSTRDAERAVALTRRARRDIRRSAGAPRLILGMFRLPRSDRLTAPR